MAYSLSQNRQRKKLMPATAAPIATLPAIGTPRPQPGGARAESPRKSTVFHAAYAHMMLRTTASKYMNLAANMNRGSYLTEAPSIRAA